MLKSICTLVAAILVSAPVIAQEKPKMDPKMQEMMERAHANAAPGAPHKILADMAGNWSHTSKFWQEEDATAQESKGSSKMKMIMGGRFLQHDIKAKMMGMPFEGMGLTGYDNVKKEYTTFWIDNMGTGMMNGEGKFDEATKTLKDEGEYSCPMTGKEQDYRAEWQIVDKNTMVYSMYGKGMDGKGKEFKTMEMTFKRK